MEIIEKKTERTVTEIQTIYRAIDGTEFNTEPECKRYEETAEAVLLSRLKECTIHNCSGEDLFECCSEGGFEAIVPTTKEHLDTMNQLYKLYGGKGESTLLFDEKDLNTLVFMGYRLYDSTIDWLWFYKAGSVIERCTDGKWTVTPKL